MEFYPSLGVAGWGGGEGNPLKIQLKFSETGLRDEGGKKGLGKKGTRIRKFHSAKTRRGSSQVRKIILNHTS